MADIAAEFKTYLKSISTITALVGATTASRIYEVTAKQGESMPYIVYETFADNSEEHLGGISGLATERIQVDCYAATSAGAYALAEVVRLAPLQMFRGTMGSTFVNGVTSPGGYRRGQTPPVKGGAQRRYWISRDYLITFVEASS